MRFPTGGLFLAGLVSVANADVKFTSPAMSASVPAGSSMVINWAESGTGTPIANLQSYTLTLMAGGNAPGTNAAITVILSNGNFATTGNTAQAVIPAQIAGQATNAYFLKMEATSTAGGTVVSYSTRFTMTGMNGQFSDVVKAGLAALPAGTTAGPQGEDAGGAAAAPAAGAGNTGSFTIPYSLQTGLTRYAPMQGVPPTKITAKSATPLFPTSAFTIATTYMPLPTILLTTTASQTYSVSSMMNTVAAASQPPEVNQAQQRFLNRWRD